MEDAGSEDTAVGGGCGGEYRGFLGCGILGVEVKTLTVITVIMLSVNTNTPALIIHVLREHEQYLRPEILREYISVRRT